MDADAGALAFSLREMTRRISIALVALVAIGLSGLWAAGIVELFDPASNPQVGGVPSLLAAQAVVGGLGITSLLCAGVYAGGRLRGRGSGQRWRAVLALALAVVLFGTGSFLAMIAASS